MTNNQWFRGMKRLHIGVGLGMLVGSACPLLSIGLMTLGLVGFFKAGKEEDKKEPKKHTDDIRNSKKYNAVSSQQGTSRASIPNIPQGEVNNAQSIGGARGRIENEAFFNRRR